MSLIFVEKRLEHWSVWAVNFANGDYGYPCQSTLASLWEGSDQPRYSKIPYVLNDVRCQETDCLVERLKHEYFRCYEAIKAYYLTTFTKAELAKYSDISIRQFERRIHDGKIWLDGAFSRNREELNKQKMIASEPRKVCN